MKAEKSSILLSIKMKLDYSCNPSYSGGRDQEDCGSKPARQIVCKTLSQKTLQKNKAGGVAQSEGLEFKP
jgi:hypothetical protein